MKRHSLNQSEENKLSAIDIEIISRQELDTDRWDRCIEASPNETPLAYSWVLDHLSPRWEGLVINNYEGVMPLPISNHSGIKMIQMPYEVLTLGLFSTSDNIRQLFPGILHHPAMARYRFISYNGSPTSEQIPTGSEKATKQTYELNLNKSYPELNHQFSRSHRRSIKNFYEKDLEILTNQNPGAFTQLISEVGAKRPELYMPPDYQKRFNAMILEAIARGKGCDYSIQAGPKVIAAVFFLQGQKRCIPYHLANTEGQKVKASFALIDYFIKKNSGKELIIDFAGSVIPNVANFNRRFGAVPKNYLSVTLNRLPYLVRLAKKMRLKHHALRILSKKNESFL